ncbi:ABC transporter substrate-binding protein [Ideonella sp.]|uniref:ABC transporter substrate-binding protein n=1 Tax=Ideonella sp. TaxID=1929293 RepID=UPI003BB73C58
MFSFRKTHAALAGLAGLLLVGLLASQWSSSAAPAEPAAARPAGTEITLMRFFGSCEAKYGRTTDPALASGECGILTALINRFNATNPDGIVVKTQVTEWGPYYDQLNARLVAKDAPTISVMHESLLGDYVRRKLVLPLDEGLAQVGVDTADFTDHARRGVTVAGQVHALPFDTWSWLWHVNLNLMRQAGLLQADGKPVLPRNPAELLEQARRFKKATGKPYFAWAVANETVAQTRTFLTLVYQQNGKLFGADGRSIDVSGPEARTALQLMKQLYDEGHIKPNADYGGANRTWLNGEAGTIVVGTWTIDQFMAEAEKSDSPLYKGYHVTPFPQLYASPALFADGHAWVLMRQGVHSEAERLAALKLLKFLYDNDVAWARTGHLPTSRAQAASPAFTSLPFRDGLLSITRNGQGMPGEVPVQRAVENLIGEEITNLVIANKPLDQVIASIDKRVNVALRKARR